MPLRFANRFARICETLVRRPRSSYQRVVQGKCPLHFLNLNGAVCSNTLFSNTSALTSSLLFRGNSTCNILEHLVWSNTSGFQFWGPLARTNFLSALCFLPSWCAYRLPTKDRYFLSFSGYFFISPKPQKILWAFMNAAFLNDILQWFMLATPAGWQRAIFGVEGKMEKKQQKNRIRPPQENRGKIVKSQGL